MALAPLNSLQDLTPLGGSLTILPCVEMNYTKPIVDFRTPTMTSTLFQPFQLHDLTLGNRIVLAPLTRGRAGMTRVANRVMMEYYVQRASAGLLITEATSISD